MKGQKQKKLKTKSKFIFIRNQSVDNYFATILFT